MREVFPHLEGYAYGVVNNLLLLVYETKIKTLKSNNNIDQPFHPQ